MKPTAPDSPRPNSQAPAKVSAPFGVRRELSQGTAAARLPPDPEAATEIEGATLIGCRAGDPDALARFVERYQHMVFAFLSRALGHSPETEDLAQEVFIRACRALPRFEEGGPARLSTWVLTIASRVASDARKRRRLSVEPIDLDVASPSRETPETERRRSELGRALAKAAASLSDDQRDVFVLAEFHGLEMKEIGLVLGIPESTAKTRLFRARERLRVLLRPIWEET